MVNQKIEKKEKLVFLFKETNNYDFNYERISIGS